MSTKTVTISLLTGLLMIALTQSWVTQSSTMRLKTPASTAATATITLFSSSAAVTESAVVVEEEATAATTLAAATRPRPPTRFDALKRKYKGPKSAAALRIAALLDDDDDDEDDVDDESGGATTTTTSTASSSSSPSSRSSSSSSSSTFELPSFTYEDFSKAVETTNFNLFDRNAVVSGTCVEYDKGGCIVDIGSKASAFLPLAEAALFQEPGQQVQDLVQLDTPYQFQIISEEDENGQLLVSLRRLQYQQAWQQVVQDQAADAVLQATVVAVNRGGAICLVHGLRAFLPGSHLAAGLLATEELIGQTLPLKFLEVNAQTNKLVVSHRKALVEQQMADLSRGDLVTGLVKAIKPYGAFVEVNGMSGLLHISQISYDRIVDLEQVLQPGMLVKCMIIDHDKVNGRIALSTKTLEPEPGDMLKHPQTVFDKAEETAKAYHARMELDRISREATARDIVLNLEDSLEGLAAAAAAADDDDDDNDKDNNSGSAAAPLDPLASVSDSLDSLLS